MTKDYTVAVTELRQHYVALGILKKTVRAQVKAEYEAKIYNEIRSRIAEAELKFAKHLAAVKERESMPVTVIQDHVLHTRTWNRWEYLRDLAEIEPEFVTAENAREARKAAEAASTWDFEEGLFYIRRGPEGNVISDPVAYRIDSIRRAGYDRTKWFADPLSESRERAEKTGLNLHAVIQEAIDNKIIDAPKED